MKEMAAGLSFLAAACGTALAGAEGKELFSSTFAASRCASGSRAGATSGRSASRR